MSTMVRGRLRPSLNWLLVFVPVSFLAAELLHNPPLTFLTAALAIIPLAGLIGRGTEELAVRAGPRVGGLLNATFGNITEMIISILLIANGQLLVVKASLIGSILGNIVLVLGASLFAGGLRFKEQQFSARSASVHGVSLFMAVIALIMPTLFTLGGNDTPFQRIVVSGGVAIVVLALVTLEAYAALGAVLLAVNGWWRGLVERLAFRPSGFGGLALAIGVWLVAVPVGALATAAVSPLLGPPQSNA